MAEQIAKPTNIPPKQGLSKASQVLGAKTIADQGECPAAETCKKIGNFREGMCYKGTPDFQKCIVGVVMLLGKQLNT
jgi:hypothetical protein